MERISQIVPDLRSARAVLLTTCLALAATSASAQLCHYSWQQIRDPGGGSASATALNNLGMVAGTIYFVGDNTRAFTWTSEGGFFRLPLPPGITSMNANGINDLGQVVGEMTSGSAYYGYIWDGQTYTIIDLPPMSRMIYVNDINNRGEVVGSLFHRVPPSTYFWDAFVWQDGAWTFFRPLTPAGAAVAEAINDRGDIVGRANDSQAVYHAFRIINRASIEWLVEPPGYSSSIAYGLNNAGTVVGLVGVSQPLHADGIVWDANGTVTYSAGTYGRDAKLYGVNGAGTAVGYYALGEVDTAFVVNGEQVSTAFELASPISYWPLFAAAINESGQIAAQINGGTVLLTPRAPAADLTGDCHVGLDDLGVLLSNFGTRSQPGNIGDIDQNGTVDLVDLAYLLIEFGQ